jgi:hypothetical protein
VDLSTFIISVFCLTDDWLKGKKRASAALLQNSQTPRSSP